MTSPAEQIAELFFFLAEDDLAELFHYFHFRQLTAGEELWQEGDPCDCMAFVVSGRLEENKETEFKGKKVVVSILGNGSLAGDACMINRQPRDTGVRALEDTALLCLSADRFDDLLAGHSELGMKLLKSMLLAVSSRLRQSVTRIASIF